MQYTEMDGAQQPRDVESSEPFHEYREVQGDNPSEAAHEIDPKSFIAELPARMKIRFDLSSLPWLKLLERATTPACTFSRVSIPLPNSVDHDTHDMPC